MMFQIKIELDPFQRERSQEHVPGLDVYLHQLLLKGFPKTFLELNPAIDHCLINLKNKIIV